MRSGCKARQYSDQMQCGKCGLAWDVKDPEPPACRPNHEQDRKRGRQLDRMSGVIEVDERLSWTQDEDGYIRNCPVCGGRFLGGASRFACFQCDKKNRHAENAGRGPEKLKELMRELGK